MINIIHMKRMRFQISLIKHKKRSVSIRHKKFHKKDVFLFLRETENKAMKKFFKKVKINNKNEIIS